MTCNDIKCTHLLTRLPIQFVQHTIVYTALYAYKLYMYYELTAFEPVVAESRDKIQHMRFYHNGKYS